MVLSSNPHSLDTSIPKPSNTQTLKKPQTFEASQQQILKPAGPSAPQSHQARPRATPAGYPSGHLIWTRLTIHCVETTHFENELRNSRLQMSPLLARAFGSTLGARVLLRRDARQCVLVQPTPATPAVALFRRDVVANLEQMSQV